VRATEEKIAMNVITTIASFGSGIRTVRGGIVTLLGHLARQITIGYSRHRALERQATIATLSDSPTNRRRQTMPVYMIADIKVTDDKWVPGYAASVHELVHKHGASTWRPAQREDA